MLTLVGSVVLFNNDPVILNASLLSFLSYEGSSKLIIIDNSFNSLSDQLISDKRIEYIHNPSNPGFGSSHNIAIKRSFELDSNYHLILNPDIYFNKGTLESIISFMNENVSIGHLMPKVLFPDESFQYLCKRNPTFFDLFARGFLPRIFKNIISKKLDKYEYRDHDFSHIIHNIPYLSGCFMFFRSKTLKSVGFFDENFFMYLEDADITRRFLKISQTVYFPDVIVYHHYSGLTHKQFKYKWITIKSAFIYFNKWGWFKSLI